MKISKRSIDQLTAISKDRFYWDDSLKGFGLKVYKSGRIAFIVQGRLNGRVRRYTLGAFGSPWTADVARAQALQYLAKLAVGIDPTVEEKAKRLHGNLKKLTMTYLRDGNLHKKPRTRDVEERFIHRHVVPLLGSKKLTEINKQDLQRFMNDIVAGKTATDERTGPRGRAIVKGGKGAANRALAVVSALFNYAIDAGICDKNPTIGIKKFRLKRHDRYLTLDELERLGASLDYAENSGQSPFAIAAIRFLLLTGCRSGEALNLQWEWIDYEHRLAKLPDSKTGQRVLLLGEGAIALLNRLECVKGSPLVFPSSKGGTTPISIQKVWRGVRAEAQMDDLRLHDLRHNFASSAVSSGQSLYIVSKLLGHTQVQTTQRYAHLAPNPMREAADEVSNRLALMIR